MELVDQYRVLKSLVHDQCGLAGLIYASLKHGETQNSVDQTLEPLPNSVMNRYAITKACSRRLVLLSYFIGINAGWPEISFLIILKRKT
jgi:hypothetical protein